MPKFLNLAIALLLTLGLITASVFIYQKGDTIFGNGKNKATNFSSQSKTMEFAEYDNQSLLGTDAIYAAELFANRPQFSVHIITKSVSGGFYATNTSATTQVCYTSATPSISGTCGTVVTPAAMKDTANTNYVNAGSVFVSKLYYDSNQAVRMVEFTQQ
ncbi:hypothetical protein [Paenibacillus cremeus]|uniref:Uncharacterized protein n=1 Tax=Paenibacillus cremeus TaxID=2163881 RepID=A0A559K5A3_9BACL|nr:hypothetical protein [Paenibacillus cremeus]TVY07319.1 hypothetical protein FPZ49_24560 [Paenibacillus cremeus]